jgi:hypothetical protein
MDTGRYRVKAIVVTDVAVRTAGMTLAEPPEPEAAGNEVVVKVHASGFTPGELSWPGTWTDPLTAFNPTERIQGKTIMRVRP